MLDIYLASGRQFTTIEKANLKQTEKQWAYSDELNEGKISRGIKNDLDKVFSKC